MENILISIQTPTINVSDLISIANTVVLIITLWVMKTGNNENTRLIRLQLAETTIVKQLEFHSNLLKGISIEYSSAGRGFGYPDAPTHAYGQDAFELLYDILKKNYSKLTESSNTNEFEVDAEEKRIKDSFAQLYEEHGNLIGNYFRNLYLLVKYINDIKIKDFDRIYYINLVKSQLSKFEILLLAYNCIWIQDKPKGQNFIELARYTNLLSELETEELIKSVSSIKHIDIFKDRYGISFRQPIEFTT